MFVKLIKTFILMTVFCTAAHAQVQDTIVVARDGSGKYRNIQEAIESVRAFMDYTVTIYIKKGVYKEKVVIPSWVKNVVFVGEDANNTIITYDDHGLNVIQVKQLVIYQLMAFPEL